MSQNKDKAYIEVSAKYFVQTYYKESDKELNGEEWDLVQSFRKIKDEESRKFVINTVKKLPK